MANTDIQLEQIIFNTLSQEKYDELKANGQINPNEIYLVPDTNEVPENVVESDNYVNAKLWKGTLAEYEALETYDDSITYIITDDNEALDVYTKEEVDNLLDNVSVDLSNYYTKSETNTIFNNVYSKSEMDELLDNVSVDLSDYYTKTETDGLLDNVYSKEEVDNLFEEAEVDLTPYLTKTDASTTYETIENVNSLRNNTYTKEEVDAKVSSVYRFKGSVASESALPTTDLVIGDVYNVEDTGANYAYNGSSWDKLSETIDLTPYLTKTDASTTYATINDVNGEIAILEQAIDLKADKSDTYTKAEVDNLLTAKANNTEVVHLAGDETIDGVKTFTSSPIVPTISDTTNSSQNAASTKFVQDVVNNAKTTITYWD